MTTDQRKRVIEIMQELLDIKAQCEAKLYADYENPEARLVDIEMSARDVASLAVVAGALKAV